MKQRIWELDALRGICVLGMICVHTVYDLVEMTGLLTWRYPAWFAFLKDWGGIVFLLLSGVCATLGTRSARRGCIVLACGLLCTAVTIGMDLLRLADSSIIIYFGVLHCLGVCMLVWPLFRGMPTWCIAMLGIGMTAVGMWLRQVVFSFSWLIPLGFCPAGFASSDYFPLLPDLGFFLLGAVIGRTLYRERMTKFPGIPESHPAVRFFCLCGRHSLLIYLLHQPILLGVMTLLST